MKKILFLTFLAACLSLIPLSISAEILSVKGEKVNMRSGPGTRYSVKWEYGSGFPVKVLQRKGAWVKVQDFEKDTGWIHKSLLTKKKQVIVRANRNLSKKINIRSGPDLKESVVGRAYYGVVFEVVSTKKDWVKVRHSTGLIGWIKKSLLWGTI